MNSTRTQFLSEPFDHKLCDAKHLKAVFIGAPQVNPIFVIYPQKFDVAHDFQAINESIIVEPQGPKANQYTVSVEQFRAMS